MASWSAMVRWCWIVLAAAACGPRRVSETAPPRSDALYFLLVDRFADGRADAGEVDRADPQAFHGGDLRGVIDHLDHLDTLGVGGLWLGPITRMRTEPIDGWGAFHGYWVTDLGEPEPRLATWAEVQELRAALDARGMRLYLDMVYNHVAYDAPLVREHPDWFHGLGDIEDWDDPVEVVTHDVHGLPDLAQEREAVYDDLLARSLPWIARAAPDGFRVDAVRHLHPGFLARLGEDLRVRGGRDLELLGEVFEGDPDALARRMATDRLTSVFDFPLYYAMKDVFCDGRAPGRLASVLGTRAYGGGDRLVTFVDNHDLPRILSACGDDLARVGRVLAFWLTARGRPCLTWGTEIGLSGAGEPENRGDMRFGEAHPMGDAVRHWLALRARWPALVDGVTTVHALTSDLLVTSRVRPDQGVLIVVNDGPERPLRVPEGLGAVAEVWVAPDLTRGDPGLVPSGAVVVARLEGDFAAAWARLRDPPEQGVEVWAEGVPAAERVALTGGGDALGAWSPEAGIPGERLGDSVRFRLQAHEGDVLAWKLVTIGPDGAATWEPRGDRYLWVQAGDPGEVRVRWGQDLPPG